MLETLTRGFRDARNRLRGMTRLTQENISEALREVRMSLLEADVDLAIVRGFLERVSERCLGEEVKLQTGRNRQRRQVSPGDHFTQACYEELIRLMGQAEPIPRAKGTRVLMLIGLQGTGKTSTAAKLGLHLKKAGERPLLVAADMRRPAAREQLEVLGEQIGVEVYSRASDDAAAICADAVMHAREARLDSVILDTAGRLQIDDELMRELEQIATHSRPEACLLVCDAMMGREAVNVARGFAERLQLDGLILTKLDGDARGGAALSIRSATGLPIRFITMGEGTDRLETFRPEGLASRILGMGDVVGLMQDFEEVVDQERAEEDARRLLQGRFTLEDFLSQLRMLQRMGPLQELVEKLPFASELLPDGAQVDESELKRIEGMILSMTPEERTRPELLGPSRRERVARGSGTKLADLGELLKRFEAMRKLMGQLGKGGGMGGMLSRIPGLGKMLGGGMAGVDPAALQELAAGGAPSNRRVARAQKAEARRQKRKNLKKHKRRGRRR